MRAMDTTEAQVRATVADLTGVDVIDIDPALADTAAFCAAYGYSMDDSANAILVIGKSDPPVYAVGVVLATTRLDVNRTVRRRLGTRKASFAPPDATRELTGMEIGGVTPFALPDGLPLWIDSRVMGGDASWSAGAAAPARSSDRRRCCCQCPPPRSSRTSP